MFHFNLAESDHSLYFAISEIRHQPSGLLLSGTLGDGSAEDCFEAVIGTRLQVRLLPVWQERDTLSERYGQNRLEQELTTQLGKLQFHSRSGFDPVSGDWQQEFQVETGEQQPLFRAAGRVCRPHQQVAESGPLWEKQTAVQV